MKEAIDKPSPPDVSADKEGPIRVLFVSPNPPKYPAGGESLGPEVLAGHLQGEFGKAVQVNHIDLQLDPDMDELVRKIWEESPHMVGLSVKIGSVPQVMEIVERIGKLSWEVGKKPLIVLGGTTATFAPVPLLEKLPVALIVRREGEIPVAGLINVIRGELMLDQIPGLTFLRDGEVVSTQPVRFDLDNYYPPARLTTARINEAGGIAWAESSRGCDHYCTFCSVPAMSGEFNPIPISTVVKDLEKLSSLGVTEISFADADFLGVPSRGLELAEAIIDSSLQIKFCFTGRADDITTERYRNDLPGDSLEEQNQYLFNVLIKLKQAGLSRVFLGIESGSEKQLKRYGKGITVEGQKMALNILREQGIEIAAGFITIDQLMNLQELKETLQFLQETGLWQSVMHPLNVLRVQEGAPYRNLLEKKSLLGRPTEDLVFYKAEFEDSSIAKVASLAQQWINEGYDIIFELKRFVEASTLDPNWQENTIVRAARQTLINLRGLEMRFITTITNMLIDNPSTELSSIVNSFKEKRDRIIGEYEDFRREF